MTMQSLREKTANELRDLLTQQKDVLRSLRFKASEGQLKTVHEISRTRRAIAQIITLLNTK